MYKLFGYGLKDIPYIKRLKNRIFYSTVITMVLLNVFINFSLNLKNVSDRALYNSIIVADLHNNLSNEQKNNLEKEIYKIKSVKSVRYMDKAESFKNLQNELNISIPEASNPLSDSIIIYVKNIENLNIIQEELENKEAIKEVYIDNSYLNKSEREGLAYVILQIGSGIFAFFIALLSIILFNLGVGIEFLNSANTGISYSKNIKKSKRKKLLSFTIATIIGGLIFLNIYLYLRKYILSINFGYNLLSFKEIILWHIGVVFAINILVWLIPANVGRIEYEDDEEAEYDDEFDDDYQDYKKNGDKNEKKTKFYKFINFDDEE